MSEMFENFFRPSVKTLWLGEIICPYVWKCSDYLKKCDRCMHNRGRKSYFKPAWLNWPR